LLRALRPRQWAKNLLVFLPLALSHRLQDRSALISASIAFLAFSLTASASYLINDLIDMERDRRDSFKRFRPFAAFALHPLAGIVAVPWLLAGSAALAYLLPHAAGRWIAAYFLTAVAYSLFLKRFAIIDVMTLAGLYTVRLFAGGAGTGVEVSQWLAAFSVFLFLSLAVLKRYCELRAMEAGGSYDNGRGYGVDDLELLRSVGTASGYCSAVVLALYINSPQVKMLYAHPQRMWALIPLTIYWLSHIWLLAHRRRLKEDPVVFVLTDARSLVIGALMLGIVVAAAF
jgi:4-hydroxybenzoate polyprenyltransferase